MKSICLADLNCLVNHIPSSTVHTNWLTGSPPPFSDKAGVCNLTWENEDEECTNSTDYTDHFTDVWNKHGDEERGNDPYYGQADSSAGLKAISHQEAFPSALQ